MSAGIASLVWIQSVSCALSQYGHVQIEVLSGKPTDGNDGVAVLRIAIPHQAPRNQAHDANGTKVSCPIGRKLPVNSQKHQDAQRRCDFLGNGTTQITGP